MHLAFKNGALDTRHPHPQNSWQKKIIIMPYFLKLFGFTGNFWKTVVTIEGLKVDSRATAHSHPFVLAYYNAALPRVGIWLLSFDWFYSPRHATLGLCICHHPCSCIPTHGIWLAIPSMAFLWTNMLFQAKQITEWTDYGGFGKEVCLSWGISRQHVSLQADSGAQDARKHPERLIDEGRNVCFLSQSVCKNSYFLFIFL